MAYIYLYTDPKTHIERYVGKGVSIYRATQHLNKTHNRQLGAMLAKRVREGFDPQPTILTSGIEGHHSANAIERFWIAVFGRDDKNTGTLFNRTEGGDGVVAGKTGFKMPPRSQQWKDRQSAARIGRKLSPEHIEANRKSMMGKNKGRIHTKVECPHCGKVGGVTIMKRWHFDNCKMKDTLCAS